MSKTRVYEYAKQNNLSSKAVIQHLKEMNVDVTNHMSTISQETKGQLDKKIHPTTKKEPVKKQESDNKKQQRSAKANNDGNKIGNKKNAQRRKQNQAKKGNQHGAKQQQGGKKQGKKQGFNKGKQQQTTKQEKRPAVKETPKKIVYSDVLTVGELAEKLHKEATEIIKKLMFLGVMATKNQDLDDDAIELICDEYNVTVEKEIILEDTDFEKYMQDDKTEDLIERPAVVTIMGHVDNGKTKIGRA